MLFRVYFVFTYLKDNKTEEITLKITCKYWKMIHRTHIKYICWWSLELLNFVQWQQLVFGSIGNVCSCIGGSSHNLEFALDLSFEEPCHYNILEDWLSSVFLLWLHNWILFLTSTFQFIPWFLFVPIQPFIFLICSSLPVGLEDCPLSFLLGQLCSHQLLLIRGELLQTSLRKFVLSRKVSVSGMI